MENIINRRKFLADTSLSAAGIVLGGNLAANTTKREPGTQSFNIMKEVMKYRKIDTHMHVRASEGDVEKQIDMADRLGIDRMVIVNPSAANPEAFRKNNDSVNKVVRQYPGRFMALFALNVLYQKESLDEISRCADMGFLGYKCYTIAKINSPVHFPIIEKLIDHKMIIHVHAVGYNGYWRSNFWIKYAPNGSEPEDYVDAAKRYPEADFQYAHIGGSGDWEYACKAIKDYPNIYVDIAGSDNEDGMTDFAVKCLGEDRVFFGTDGSPYQGVGNVLASSLNDLQKKKVFFDNYNNLLKKGGRNVA